MTIATIETLIDLISGQTDRNADYAAKVQAAHDFAAAAHSSIGQVRKYTNEPYIHHPIEVASFVAFFAPSSPAAAIQAALLHDVVEDTPVSLEDVERAFGEEVALLVADLTDVSTPPDGNRKARKDIDRAHTAAGSYWAKSIKLADLMSNTQSIAEHDKNFAVVYLKEKEAVLEVLVDAHAGLYNAAADALVHAKLALLEP